VRSLCFLAAKGAAVIVAWRNLRSGRGDRRTALRLGLYLGAMRLLWLAGAQHQASTVEIDLLTAHVAYALYRVALVAVFYLALEPYARRLWPEMLVSWVRIFDGRVRDPRVGRDVLLGVAYGLGAGVLSAFMYWVPDRLGLPSFGLVLDLWSGEALRGVRHALATVAAFHTAAVTDAFIAIMLFVALRLLTGRTWLAVAIDTVLGLIVFSPESGNVFLYLAVMGPYLALFWLVLFRAGFFALALGMSVSTLLTLPLTFELTAWHAAPTWIVLVLLALLTGWGFRTALAGQPLFRDEILGAEAAAR
jgi:hypothetical protein